MKKKYFGTDGIRGTVNKFPIIETFFQKFAVALVKSKKNTKNILIGKDTRESGIMIEKSLLDGFNSQNIFPDFFGVISTPMLSFYTKHFKYDFGIMISASHNPYKDNGIKVFKKNGQKLNDSEEMKIEKIINSLNPLKITNKNKLIYKKPNFNLYKNFILKKFPNITNINIKILLDCANGSLHSFAPVFFKDFGAKVIEYGCKPNGRNINKNCGAMFPNKLSKLTIKNRADLGLSFDGDADRVIVSDEKGNIIDGDIILAAISKFYDGKRKKNSIVSTKMSNLSFRDFLKKNGVKLLLTDVGDRYVIEKMKSSKINLGGEPSGHIIFSENGYCGDGILTSLYLIDIILRKKFKFSYLSENLFSKNFQKLVNLKLKNEVEDIMSNSSIKRKIKTLSNLLPDIDFLIRKSGTENLLRIMVQSKNKKDAKKFLEDVTKLVLKRDG